jgi:hypothetical protein
MIPLRFYLVMLGATLLLAAVLTVLLRAVLWLIVFAPDALFGAIALTFVIGVFVLMLGRELGK